MRASGAGINMEGLLYLQKYGIVGPEFGTKEEFVTDLPCKVQGFKVLLPVHEQGGLLSAARPTNRR